MLAKGPYLARRWLLLEPWEKRALLSFAWRLPASWIWLRSVSFKTLWRSLHRKPAEQNTVVIAAGLTPLAWSQRCTQLLSIAANLAFPQANCLQKSVALCSYLRAHGLPAELKIGARKDGRDLQAHAWVVLEQHSLGEPESGSYSEFPVFVQTEQKPSPG